MCDNDPDTPFCSPQDGAQLQVGEIAEIIWNPNFFTTSNPADPPQQIFIQADFALTSTNGPPETAGFTSAPLDPNTGFFPWTILSTYLPPTSNTTTATLSLAAPLSHAPTTNGTFVRIGAATIRFPGPRVHILRANTNTNTNTNTTLTNTNSPLTNSTATEPTPEPTAAPNPLAIALPIALGLLTALAMALYAILKRHRPEVLARLGLGGCGCLGWWRRRGGRGRQEGMGGGVGGVMGGSGYGGGYGYGGGEGGGGGGGSGGRVKLKGRAVEIRVVKTDLEGLRGNARRMMGVEGQAGNVFREEVRRQELARGRV
ncbi:hypothetical protein F5144DRAFT_649681 [Chaetomium tenue]|uniref:Uncharacterized protein n=1 Tax=Chaetomium tenue TaxID=1854479 RepID=A0ACB7P7V6_9PEZI|nr:hypothetical protein F5144DRAFT_649681 [Chaetomium globosum]